MSVWGVERDDGAVIDNRDSIAQRLGLIHVMGGERDSELAFLAQLNQQIVHGQPALRIEADGRLIEEQDLSGE